jgi:heme o synthase
VSDTSVNFRSSAVASAAAVGQGPATVGDFVALLKPRVMSLVVFTGLVGLYLAPGTLHPVLSAVAILCIAVGAGASGAINMWYDRDIDAIMTRTQNRPIPAGRVEPNEALAFGVILSAISVVVMGLAVNWAASVLLAFTIGFYVVIYTMWLKRRTPQNIVIGGASGALPPIIGWAAITGDVSLESVALFAIIFMWTPPHFWALSLYRDGDYQKAGVPMLPVVAGRRETQRQIMFYSVAMVPVTLAPWYLGTVGVVYGAAASVLGLLFLGHAFQVLRDDSARNCKRMFGFSILYLALIFTMLVVDRAILGGLS